MSNRNNRFKSGWWIALAPVGFFAWWAILAGVATLIEKLTG